METLTRLGGALGLRPPRTSLTRNEHELLRAFATRARRVAELGVYEGATSALLASAMERGTKLLLIDPFVPALRVERWLGRSLLRVVARRSVRSVRPETCFLECTSAEAAARVDGEFDLVFVDADHAYEVVRSDFEAWGRKVAAGGVLAFHDSRTCAARPDLDEKAGPVRLVREMEGGLFPPWRVVEAADSLSVVARRAAGSGR